MDLQHQNGFIEDCRRIETVCRNVLVRRRHRQISRHLRRIFLAIPQLPFEYGRVPGDWSRFIRNEQGKTRLYEQGIEILTLLLRQQGLGECARVYGGVKDVTALERKLRGQLEAGAVGIRGLPDSWDAVRYRIVCRDVICLHRLCYAVWTEFVDRVVRCTNFYVAPKHGTLDHPYRAVHFEVRLVDDRIVEVQAMTENRETMCWLDHFHVYKRIAAPRSWVHGAWLGNTSRKASIADGRDVEIENWDVMAVRHSSHASPDYS
jgi:hypothetical protein